MPRARASSAGLRSRCSSRATGYLPPSTSSSRPWTPISAGTTRRGSRSRSAASAPQHTAEALGFLFNQSQFLSAPPVGQFSVGANTWHPDTVSGSSVGCLLTGAGVIRRGMGSVYLQRSGATWGGVNTYLCTGGGRIRAAACSWSVRG
jgi:hypothetical protein